MKDDHIADAAHSAVQGDRPEEPATIDATGAYVPAVSTESGRKATEPPAGSPTIPGYVITGIIAKGGMGCVHAGHDLTLDREVAIKTLLPGANPERFVTEAKITARLPHPNIPPVHALGTLDDGTPWLAMKLIRGRTLQDLLPSAPRGRGAGGEGKPDHSRLIQIFEQICQAVGFAHSRGIIHRDLKPLNVMVGEFGEVQVMDWGLAKDVRSPSSMAHLGEQSQAADDGRGTTDTGEHTAAGAIMGTPGYMAPEQARGDTVDTRADVFALGSVLATILTTMPAFVGATARETIGKAANAELTDVLARLDACGVDADLLGLCKRCLSAKPEDRPADGQVVANEVAAYRAGVERRLRQAETDRAAAAVREIETRKRQRALLVAAVLIVAVLLAGLGASLWQMVRAIAAESQAVAERDAKDTALRAESAALAAAQAARAEAERNLGFANAGNDILGSVFMGLDPRANYATVADFQKALKANLRKAVAELDRSAVGDPLTVAKMQDILGISLFGLGERGLAIEVLEKSRAARLARNGPNHIDTISTTSNLATCFLEAGEHSRAEPLLEETFAARKETLGPTHPHTLSSMHNLSQLYTTTGKFDKALPLVEETFRLRQAQFGRDHPNTLTSMNTLALTYRAVGKPDKALPLLEEALEGFKLKLGPDHPYTLSSMLNLSAGYRSVGRFDKCLPLLEESVPRMKSKLGIDHPYTLVGMSSLAEVYHNSGRDDLALPLFKETLLLQEAKLGPDHPDTIISKNNLAAGYLRAGETDLATSLLEEVLKRRKAKLGVDHPDTVSTMFDLGPLRMLARDYAGAEELLLACEEAVASGQVGIRREIRDDIVARLVDLYDAWGKPMEAEMWLAKLPAEQQIRVGLQRYNAWPLLWGRPQF